MPNEVDLWFVRMHFITVWLVSLRTAFTLPRVVTYRYACLGENRYVSQNCTGVYSLSNIDNCKSKKSCHKLIFHLLFRPSERSELPQFYDGQVFTIIWWPTCGQLHQAFYFGKLTPIRINSKARPVVGRVIYNLSKKHLGHKLVRNAPT